jgi:hypothetical protein
MSARRSKKNKQALINQVLTSAIKNQMNKKDGRQRTRISREDINTSMHIHSKWTKNHDEQSTKEYVYIRG